MVNWQLAKRRAGTHKTKERLAKSAARPRSPIKQKGTGRARQGCLRSPQFRGGAMIFGPGGAQPRAPTCRRRSASSRLKTALSAKLAEGKLIVLETRRRSRARPRTLAKRLAGLGWGRVLIIDGPDGR